MSRAVIVVGHELQAHEEAQSFEYFLHVRAGIKLVKQISAWNKTDSLLLGLIANQGYLAGRQPLLIVYIGHGSEDGWAYGKHDADTWLELPYARLVDALGLCRKGPTLVVNDCCHAAALAAALCGQDDAFPEVGVISASSANGATYNGHIGATVQAAWSERKPFVPPVSEPESGKLSQQCRWGPELDHHFFAKT